MTTESAVIRDPLWDNIRLEPAAAVAIDTPTFQRMRYVRQLGHAFLVYPGATHSRFEHALGAYHLTRRALSTLEERGDLAGVDDRECLAVRLAALLHDIGHYPFSHALEEAGFGSHEQLGARRLREGALGALLKSLGGDRLIERIAALIQGTSDSPLAGLVSGSLDLDKIDYLSRDARMCGVPYGTVDVDRLLSSLALVRHDDGSREMGVRAKGVSALESLLFAKYQMYRNVYWHHAVRSATAMYKRLVDGALRAGSLSAETLAKFTDEGLLHELAEHAPTALLSAMRERRLYKRIFECPAAELPADIGEWIADDRSLVTAVEDQLARELHLQPGELLLDYPVKTEMLGLDIPVRRRDGSVRRLTAAGWEGAVNLPKLSEELYGSARWLRVFTAQRVAISREAVVKLASLPSDEVRSLVAGGKPLLSS
jgi:HD superfamily phosphohydrolase